MSKAIVFNLGCKVNQYECDTIATYLKELGYETSENLEKADVYIINTCAVTGEAERKSRQIIARICKLNPQAKIMVTGCASQKNKDFYIQKDISYIGGVAHKSDIAKYIGKNHIENTALPLKYEEFSNYPIGQRTRTYVKIQDGCNNFCSYCIIPHLRGRSRSRTVESAATEIIALARSTKEIVITGINLSHYGEDNGESLTQLISRIKNVDVRIRLGSFYVEGITKGLLEELFSLKKFCPHFHLSLQHGDNDVLKSMNRRYTTEDYKAKVALIRQYDINAAITTDIIVGFPTETEAAFNNTVQFIDDVGFADIHIFPYSQREGTSAYALGILNPDFIKTRKKILDAERAKLHKQYLTSMLNTAQEVLIETKTTEGLAEGYSQYYIRTYVNTDQDSCLVLPTEIFKDGQKGEVINGK